MGSTSISRAHSKLNVGKSRIFVNASYRTCLYSRVATGPSSFLRIRLKIEKAIS